MASSSNSPRVIMIGIAGPSCCGKSSYAIHLADHLHSPIYPIELDHFYIRGIPINHPVLGRTVSEEEPETLFTEGLLTLLREIKHHPEKQTRYHCTNFSIQDNQPIYVIVEGFLLFALSDELTNMFDIRIFFESIQSQCQIRRYRRQHKIPQTIPDEQVNMPEKFQQWFDYLVWDGYLKRRDLQISKVQRVFQPNEYQNRVYIHIDKYIDQRLKGLIG